MWVADGGTGGGTDGRTDDGNEFLVGVMVDAADENEVLVGVRIDATDVGVRTDAAEGSSFDKLSGTELGSILKMKIR